MRFGSEIQYRIRPVLPKDALHLRAVADIGVDEDDTWIVKDPFEFAQASGVGQLVDDDDAVGSVLDRVMNEVGPIKPAPPVISSVLLTLGRPPIALTPIGNEIGLGVTAAISLPALFETLELHVSALTRQSLSTCAGSSGFTRNAPPNRWVSNCSTLSATEDVIAATDLDGHLSPVKATEDR